MVKGVLFNIDPSVTGEWDIVFRGEAKFGRSILRRAATLSRGTITVSHTPYRLARRKIDDGYIEERTPLCRT